MTDTATDDDTEQWEAWSTKEVELVIEFAQGDEELGQHMFDYLERFWVDCYHDGLTPQQALDAGIALLSGKPVQSTVLPI